MSQERQATFVRHLCVCECHVACAGHAESFAVRPRLTLSPEVWAPRTREACGGQAGGRPEGMLATGSWPGGRPPRHLWGTCSRPGCCSRRAWRPGGRGHERPAGSPALPVGGRLAGAAAQPGALPCWLGWAAGTVWPSAGCPVLPGSGTSLRPSPVALGVPLPCPEEEEGPQAPREDRA